jgi:multimeric flavodoxin WrbA/putative sterol carrier protein
MKRKLNTILFITSFIPVIIFKVAARVGEVSLAQAKGATAIGLVLAATQFILSKRFLNHTTYLERAFLGFLGAGAAWVYLFPPHLAFLFVQHSTTLLYLVLFLTTFVPQLLAYDPFTYAIAKQWYPETVWKTPQFKTINLHITYVWSSLFLFSGLSSWLGEGRPAFSIMIPLLLLLGVGLPFSRRYPDYYLKHRFPLQPVDPSLFPDTAKELISRMPLGFDPSRAPDLRAEIQFDLSGPGGGKMGLSISNRQCRFREGEFHSPALIIRAPGDTWLKIARGEISRPRAFMDGLFKAEGDMGLLMKMGEIFHPPTKGVETKGIEVDSDRDKNRIEKGENTMVKILAIQGSPRPKESNTEILLQEFLKGARSQGAETETLYLKEKKIHPCIGCYTCWTKTPGTCVFNDDMPELLEKVGESDVLVYATPLYNYNMTALLKAFQERLLPRLDPHLVKTGETYRHPQRYEKTRKAVLLSTCGFPEISHFDPLRHLFRHIEGNGGAPVIGEILMPAGELLKQEGMRDQVQEVLRAAYQAGMELVRDGRVSKETEAKIQKPLLSPDEMAEMANLWWDGHLQRITQGKPTQGKVEDMRLLLKGMAATFNAKTAGAMKAVIQFEVTGKQTGNWFLSIENGKCTCHDGLADAPTLTINTPSEIWLAIANRELDGQQAFLEGKYSVQGDMALLMRMKSLFGGSH